MAYSFEFEGTDPMTLDEYIQFITENVDVSDEESLKESAQALHALSLNKGVFDKIIKDAIKKNASIGGLQDSYNVYTDATFLLGGSPDGSFFVRANVWKKPKEVSGNFDYDHDLYSYYAAHDHNFDFVTVGYFGPGYRTRIYEYENAKVIGRVGEPVDLRFLEETSLPAGKVMMYRKSLDVHTQIPPTATSISLNLMVPPPSERYAEQYYFGAEDGQLEGFVTGRSNYQVSVLSLAAELGDEDLLEPLVSIATGSVCARTRAAAVASALKIAPATREMMLSRCGSDPSPLVAEALGLAT